MTVRRILTIPLIIVFVLVFIVVLVLTQVNCTVGAPAFYTDRLANTDSYNFIYDDVVPAALDEIDTDNPSDSPIDTDSIKDEAIANAMAILPPEWLQQQVDAAVNAVFPYLVGGTDEFTYTITFKDRVEEAARVIKEDTLRSQAFESLYDDGVSYLAEQLVENQGSMPFNLGLTQSEVEAAIRAAVPLTWVIPQVEAAVDAVEPYFSGESDHFVITVQFSDRVDAVAGSFLNLINRDATYDYLLDELVTPVIEENLGHIVDLPYGISFTQQEIASAIEEALPREWVRARLHEIVDELTAYVKGEADTIEVVIDLTGRKAAALETITQMADEKLSELYYGLPTCSIGEFLQLVQDLEPDEVPSCRPTGLTYEAFKTLAGVDVAAVVEEEIGDQIPNQWTYTTDDLINSVGEGNEDFLEEARDRVTNGWTYTDADLMSELDGSQQDTLSDVRGWIESGYTVSEEDLEEAMMDAGMDIESFDSVRQWTGTARTWMWALWILPFLGLLSIGMLGGRDWRGRATWALAVLLVTSLAVYITLEVAYPRAGEPRLQEAMLEPSDYDGIEAKLAEQANVIIMDSASAFQHGMQSRMIQFMVGSSVVFVAISGWTVLRSGTVRLRRRPQSTQAGKVEAPGGD